MIGLVTHALRLPREAARIMASLAALGAVTKRVKACVITEADYPAADPVCLNVAAAKNMGLRKLLPDCEGIACIDTDCILPPGLFEFLLEPTVQSFHVWVKCRPCTEAEAGRRAWAEWLNLPTYYHGRGSCNYMSRDNWLRVGGWDERACGWGGEDDILHLRAGQLGIECRPISMIPLMHVEHEPRVWRSQGENTVNNARWADEDQKNYLLGEGAGLIS